LDGSTLATNLPFCGNNFGPCNGASVAELGWALFNTFGNGNDFGYMDNFRIATEAAFAGTPGKPNCHGKSASALSQQYGGLNAAAAALDYPSVQALQEAIMEYCEG
jgi:hypothetical protein